MKTNRRGYLAPTGSPNAPHLLKQTQGVAEKTMARPVNSHERETRHVDVVTSRDGGTVIGYKVQGARPGPNVLVAGYSPTADSIYDRLMSLPTLPWLRGSLSLIMLNTPQTTEQLEPSFYSPNEQIDEVLFLPFVSEYSEDLGHIKDGYWIILRFCGRLGMIDGRGVSQRH